MYNGGYYGEKEVRLMLERFINAPDSVKERVKQYILDSEYGIDEENFLELIQINDVDAAFEFYADMDTAAREMFFALLEKHENSLLANMFVQKLTDYEAQLLNAAIEETIKNLVQLKKDAESFGSVRSAIDKRLDSYYDLRKVFRVVMEDMD